LLALRLALALALCLAPPALAQAPGTIPATRDIDYPGVLRLEVDATDIQRRIFRVRQTIPLAVSGPVTLMLPKWLPGNHAPRGQIEKIAGLTLAIDGRPVSWTRDPIEVYAFHLQAPEGARELVAEFQYLSPTLPSQGRVVVTPEMLNLQWNLMALYPAGFATTRMPIQASVTLPTGWGYGVALDTVSREGDTVRFAPVPFTTLVDSPMFAGRHHRQIDLDPGARIPVRLAVVGDTASELAATPEVINIHRELIRQSDRLFGWRPFDRYDFLLAISSRLGSIGLEHHRSSENKVEPGYFTAWDRALSDRGLLPHEYAHAWVGKAVRPSGMIVQDFHTPVRNDLLWVYEGQDTYWGEVLAARSGFLSRQQALDSLALDAAALDTRAGRRWRDLEDTTYDPIINARRPQPWVSQQRWEDYYAEGSLIWLDADTLIRERSGGRRSLDDFARRFHAGRDGDFTPRGFTFEDIVAALNAVEPYDWAGFLTMRIREVAPRAPLDGLARGGWRLVYAETPTDYARIVTGRLASFAYSLGLTLNRDGEAVSVIWDSPAFKAGLAVGARILAVNGLSYDEDRLAAAVTEAKSGRPIELVVRTGEHFRTVSIAYTGGLRHPRLERIPGAPDLLSEILKPR
jgi:predicted metalloprotease with PDZ domain